MAGRTLTIDIKTADAQTLAALKRIQKELKDTGGVAERTSKQGLSLGSALGGLAIGAGISKSIGEFEEAETSARATAAAIEATGNAAGISAEEQAKLVDALSKTAALDDEVVNGAANMLRQFDQIKGAKFGETLAASADVAAAKNIELSASSQMLGKALQDPFTGYTKLQRVIGPFSDATKAQIAAFEKTNDVAGAQGVILAELEKRFGGQAEAAVTDSAKMKVAFDDAAESLGGALAPALSGAANVAGWASEEFQGLPQPLQQAALAGGALAIVGPKIADGWSSAADSISGTAGALRGSVSDFGLVKSGALGAAVGISSYNLAYAALEDLAKSNVDTAGLAEDLALVGKGVTDTQPVLDQYGGSIEELTNNVQLLSAAYSRDFGTNLTTALRDGDMFGQYSSNLNNIKNELGDLDSALATLAKTSPEEAKVAFDTLTQAMFEQGATAEDIVAVFPNYYDAVDRAAASNKKATETTKEATASAKDYLDTLDGLTEKQDARATADQAVSAAVIDVAQAQDKVAQAEQGVADAQDAVASANDAVADARRGVADAEKGVRDALKGVEQAQRGVTEAEDAAVDARTAVTDATVALAQAQDDAKAGSEYLADAEERLAQSQADSQTAQEALTQARQDYQATMKDLATDVAAATDDVTLAQIAIDDAKKRLAELMADPEATANDRKRAEIAVREAERRLAELEQRLKDAQETFDRNNAGVETSDAVAEAHKKADEAAANQQTAEENLADAQETANKRVEAAQDDLTEAIKRRSAADQRVLDAKQSVVDANDRVATAVRGVEDANNRVTIAVDNVRGAQQRVTDAKEAVKTARGEVETAERKVEAAVKDQYKAYQDLSEFFKPGSPARVRMEWLTEQLRLQHDYLAGITVPFVDVFNGGGKSTPGGKSERNSKSMENDHGPSGDKTGSTPAAASSSSSAPETRPGGWVRQPNGRWWRPRKPGEANYGDGYVDADEMMRIRQAEEAARASESRHTTTPTGGSTPQVVVHMSLADVSDPAATAEIINKRLGWELRRLIGSAA